MFDNPATARIDESADNIFPPDDLGDFMFSTAAWANAGNVSRTGLDDIDLWVGGLAELSNLFGGLLGSTFNYVFENQLTNLQNGDRFYYLARTQDMNLRAQLEGNSFADLVMRNTNVNPESRRVRDGRLQVRAGPSYFSCERRQFYHRPRLGQ